MPDEKKNKLTNGEQIVLVIVGVAVFMILKNIAEYSLGITGIVVWAITGAIGGMAGWGVMKIFKIVRKNK